MQAFLTRTKIGRAIRATSMDIGAAQLSGVRVAHLYAIVFGLGAGLAGAAGVLISLSYSLQPSMGDPFIIKAFVVCVLGGLGSVEGALVGGLLYGILESFGSQYVGTGVQDAVALVVLLIVLIVRPTRHHGQGDGLVARTPAPATAAPLRRIGLGGITGKPGALASRRRPRRCSAFVPLLHNGYFENLASRRVDVRDAEPWAGT